MLTVSAHFMPPTTQLLSLGSILQKYLLFLILTHRNLFTWLTLGLSPNRVSWTLDVSLVFSFNFCLPSKHHFYENPLPWLETPQGFWGSGSGVDLTAMALDSCKVHYHIGNVAQLSFVLPYQSESDCRHWVKISRCEGKPQNLPPCWFQEKL